MLSQEDYKRIAELTEQNEEFAVAIQQINEENKLTTSKMSHEIRNMLTLIGSSLQMIETKHPEVKEFHFWDQVLEDVKTTNEMLADFSKYNNMLQVNRKSGDIISLIRTTADSFRAECEKRGISLEVIIEPETTEYAADYPFDEVRMKQALINLIKNAMEACRQKDRITVSLSLDKTVAKNEKSLLLQVADSGYSIDKSIMKKLFEPYFTTKDTGSGLGLSIVKRIIYSHGGDISIESNDALTKVSCFLPTK